MRTKVSVHSDYSHDQRRLVFERSDSGYPPGFRRLRFRSFNIQLPQPSAAGVTPRFGRYQRGETKWNSEFFRYKSNRRLMRASVLFNA